MSGRKTAILWFLGGAAFLVAGLISEPRRPLTLIAAAAFFAVGVASIVRDRG
jgi:hypothetical protein